jgi:predicted RNA polymerase sigma factor
VDFDTNIFLNSIATMILSADAKVMELIDQDTKLWNSPLIKKIFQEEEARVICR